MAEPQPVERTEPVLLEFGERLLWVRVFELGVSRRRMAELLGDGFDDSTLGNWEKLTNTPHDTAAVARRYREVAKELGKEVDKDWLLDGSGLLVTFLTYADTLVMVDEGQLRLPFELPPPRRTPELTLV